MAVAYRVQVFARAPVSGEVKTRLIPCIGADAAARLQTTLTQTALSTARAAAIGPVELWCSPDASHPFFESLGRDGIALREQEGADIGERMYRALSEALNCGGVAVLIGSDCPSLTPRDLQEAANALQQGNDFVFVPAEDGGYVLVAARTVSRQLFEGIEWGTDRVMMQTRGRLRELGHCWTELDERRDIDRPEDYQRLLRELPHVLQDAS